MDICYTAGICFLFGMNVWKITDSMLLLEKTRDNLIYTPCIVNIQLNIIKGLLGPSLQKLINYANFCSIGIFLMGGGDFSDYSILEKSDALVHFIILYKK